ncbi:translocation/assembly module TamB domain-containing protein [Halobacteriovorax sp.]|uniref:translocation/assembly module TamB domain-containing protein n=1 Tax=Halobacteriovorax sp. TaxID=2020862 RepID=UPI003AF2E517
MKVMNKFLIVFTIVFTIIGVGAWNFIQSQYVSTILSEYINNNLISNENIQLKFSKVSGGFFPPRTILNNVNLVVKDEVEIQVKDVSAVFSIMSLFSSEIKFSRVSFDDGYIVLNQINTKKENDEKDDIGHFERLTQITKKLPFQINQVQIMNSDFYLEQADVNIPISFLSISPYESSFDIVLDIERFYWNGLAVDNLFLDAEIVEESIRLRNAYVFVKDSKITGTGKYEFKSRKIDADIEYRVNFDSFYSLLKKHNLNLNGLVEGKADLTGDLSLEGLYVNGNVVGDNISSDYVIAEKVNTYFTYHNKSLVLRKLKGSVNKGTFKLLNDLTLDFKSKKVVATNTSVELSNLHLNDILYFLGDDLEMLKGRINGVVNLKMNGGGDLFITSDSLRRLSFTNLSLRPSNTNILNMKEGKINSLSIIIDNRFAIEIDANINKSHLLANGTIKGKAVDFNVEGRGLELSDLGGEVGAIGSGRGDIDIKISGKDEVFIDVTSRDVNNLKVYDYLFEGPSSVKARYSINSNKIFIDSISNNVSGKTDLMGFVDIPKSLLNLDLKFTELDIATSKRRLDPIWKDIKLYVEPFAGIFNGNANISGSFNNIKTTANLTSSKVSLYNEAMDNFAIEMAVDKNQIDVKNLFLKKGVSSLSSDFAYRYDKGFDRINLVTTPIKLNDFFRYRDIGLGYNGYFSINLNAKRGKNFKGNGSAYLTRTKIGNEEIGSSELEFKFTDSVIDFDSQFLNGEIDLEGILDLSKQYPKVDLNYDVDIPNLRTFLSVISEHNAFNNQLNGFMQMAGQISYDFNSDMPMSATSTINQFHLNNYGRDLTLRRPTQIEIEQSEIKKLNFLLEGSGGRYYVTGTGNVDSRFELIQELDINLSYLTLLTSEIERILGNIKGRGIIYGNRRNYDISHSFSTSGFGLKLKSIPLEIANANGIGAYRDKKILINSLSGELGSGRFDLSGYIKANFPFPEVYLNADYSDVGYQVESRSLINTDGKLSFSGKSFPYLVKGDVFVNGGLVENEFNDFKSTSEYNKSLNKYITQTKRGIPDLINLDIDLKIKETVRVRNRLADLLVAGDLSIKGQFNNPEMQGQLIIVPGVSKFKFRGNDFILSEGVVYFTRQENLDPITLNLLANSTIGQYDIEMGITGSVEDISINLESNPYLTRDNIFSLLTLGVTSDFSKNLEDSQRTNLTTIGIGTFLVDQLNINEGLDSALGLKLSVLPEFSESSDSPIEEATKSEQSVKTATKLQITKKVNENIDLKFSNTFDSENTRQSINVDYSISDKLSIEGIFESEDDTNNKERTDGSAGADIKYKWSF